MSVADPPTDADEQLLGELLRRVGDEHREGLEPWELAVLYRSAQRLRGPEDGNGRGAARGDDGKHPNGGGHGTAEESAGSSGAAERSRGKRGNDGGYGRNEPTSAGAGAQDGGGIAEDREQLLARAVERGLREAATLGETARYAELAEIAERVRLELRRVLADAGPTEWDELGKEPYYLLFQLEKRHHRLWQERAETLEHALRRIARGTAGYSLVAEDAAREAKGLHAIHEIALAALAEPRPATDPAAEAEAARTGPWHTMAETPPTEVQVLLRDCWGLAYVGRFEVANGSASFAILPVTPRREDLPSALWMRIPQAP